MNYIRDIIHRMEWDDEINELFDQFVDDVNEMPFNTEYENTPEFLLNQSIINNAYLLRRTIELYPQEQRNVLRRSMRIRTRTQNHETEPVPPLNTPTYISFSDDENDRHNAYVNRINRQRPQRPQRTQRIVQNEYNEYNEYDDDTIWTNSRIWNPLELQLATNSFTDTLFTSLFTNFNQFMEQNLNDLEDVKVTLSEDEFNKLKIVNDETLIENKQCNICLEELTKDELNDDKLLQLKCQHIYHNDCIKEWLLKQSTKCPTCRTCCRTSTNSE